MLFAFYTHKSKSCLQKKKKNSQGKCAWNFPVESHISFSWFRGTSIWQTLMQWAKSVFTTLCFCTYGEYAYGKSYSVAAILL